MALQIISDMCSSGNCRLSEKHCISLMDLIFIVFMWVIHSGSRASCQYWLHL